MAKQEIIKGNKAELLQSLHRQAQKRANRPQTLLSNLVTTIHDRLRGNKKWQKTSNDLLAVERSDRASRIPIEKTPELPENNQGSD